MRIATKIPVTLAERLELGAEIVRFSATFEEYLDLLDEAGYNVEFDNNQIIAMSIASDSHEVLVSNMIANLYNALANQPDMAVRGSNRHVFIKEFGADYAPDAHIVKGKPQIHTLRKGLTANLNPWLIVEILSPSTRNRDWSEKLPRYKKIPSLRHIFYIEQDRPFVSVFNRVGASMEWLNIDYDHLEQSFTVFGKLIKLAAIYNNVTFPSME